MPLTLEPNEITFLQTLLKNLSINPSQPDAIGITQTVQSLLAKLAAGGLP